MDLLQMLYWTIVFIGVIILLIFIPLIRFLMFSQQNSHMIKKYNRENHDKKFKEQRCLEDGDYNRRHHVYLVDEEAETYQRIKDSYTLNRLGWGSGSRENDKCFSKKNYTMGDRIEIHKIFIFKPKELLDFLKVIIN